MLNLKSIKIISLIFLFFFTLSLISKKIIAASPNLNSDNYRITWPNLNMAGGGSTSPDYRMTITGGQTSPGLYSSSGYKIRSGFQYIYSIIPFSFRISALSLDFGELTTDVLTNQKTLTLKVNSGSAGGYQVTVQENKALTSTAGTTIIDTSCDGTNTCDQNDSGTWALTSTYGFGYTMTGKDVPTEFSSSKYKRFANASNLPTENPVKIMGLTPAEYVVAEKDKVATMSARINVNGLQAAGVYHNVLTFTAIPTF
jgi:hypothetical protein